MTYQRWQCRTPCQIASPSEPSRASSTQSFSSTISHLSIMLEYRLVDSSTHLRDFLNVPDGLEARLELAKGGHVARARRRGRLGGEAGNTLPGKHYGSGREMSGGESWTCAPTRASTTSGERGKRLRPGLPTTEHCVSTSCFSLFRSRSPSSLKTWIYKMQCT